MGGFGRGLFACALSLLLNGCGAEVVCTTEEGVQLLDGAHDCEGFQSVVTRTVALMGDAPGFTRETFLRNIHGYAVSVHPKSDGKAFLGLDGQRKAGETFCDYGGIRLANDDWRDASNALPHELSHAAELCAVDATQPRGSMEYSHPEWRSRGLFELIDESRAP